MISAETYKSEGITAPCIFIVHIICIYLFQFLNKIVTQMMIIAVTVNTTMVDEITMNINEIDPVVD